MTGHIAGPAAVSSVGLATSAHFASRGLHQKHKEQENCGKSRESPDLLAFHAKDLIMVAELFMVQRRHRPMHKRSAAGWTYSRAFAESPSPRGQSSTNCASAAFQA
jgi:hypothetical protein